ncbi:Wadjet anti-phage system protein JetD domain-containing protein [Paenibacillus sp. FSL R7-0297]|uniref:Wadjet anti-phage system protein JetD domain-containing protein n=1 Tax=Paenibacillus sp. FSL R7-0297 TaxID=2921680 RepID=UPI0030F7F9C1
MSTKWIKTYLESLKRQTFDIFSLEKTVQNHIGMKAFEYASFANDIKALERDGVIEPVKSKMKNHQNGRFPVLPIYWRVLRMKEEPRWDMRKMVQLAAVIDLSFYQSHPECQTEETWRRIESVAAFFMDLAPKSWVEREERSYQLFHDEKWLKEKSAEFLRRLKLSLSDLYVQVSPEPFVHWHKPGKLLEDTREILIVENRAIYHTCLRIMREGLPVCGFRPDMLIYGEGNHIHTSLPYLMELGVPVGLCTIFYSGDFDPSGFWIYSKLRRTYPDYPIHLALSLYASIAYHARVPVEVKPGQPKGEDDVQIFFEDCSGYQDVELAARRSWKERHRLPQEALSYEVLKGEVPHEH